MTRPKTSRPSSSVPNQCGKDGGLPATAQLGPLGTYGNNTGTSNAARTPARAFQRLGMGAADRRRMDDGISHGSRPQSWIDQDIGEIRHQVQHEAQHRLTARSIRKVLTAISPP